MQSKQRCYACDKPLGRNPATADTRDDQWVFVGRECYKQIIAAGTRGYQPPKGGPKLYPLTAAALAQYKERGIGF